MNERNRESVGSVAEEAAKLFAALQQRLGRPDGEWSHTGGPDAAAAQPAECRACPLCQVLAAVRTVRPEVVEHLVAAADSLAAALRVAFDGAERPNHQHDGTPPPDGAGDGRRPGPGAAEPPPVERIDIS